MTNEERAEQERNNDPRRISMPNAVYEQDLANATWRGRKEAMRRFFLILKQAKEDKRDAVNMIVEEFEGDQREIDSMLINLDLMATAEEMWKS